MRIVCARPGPFMADRVVAFWLLSLVLLAGAAAAESASGIFSEMGFPPKRNISQKIYERAFDRASLTNRVGVFLALTDQACRKHAVEMGKSHNQIGSLAGAWLEYSMMVTLRAHKRTPCYYQTELKVLPNNVFDVFLWTKEHGPVVISCKTSLRERYKQADLEGIALGRHYPNARSFLVTLDADKRHVANCQRKIVDGEITGLQGIYDEKNIDELFAWLAKRTIVPIPDDVGVKRARSVR